MHENLSIQDILEWYIEAGVDETCPNVFHPIVKQNEISQKPMIRRATTDLAQDFIASKQSARDICTKAQTLAELKKIVADFDGCALKLTAKSTVFGAGNEKAELMFIGEAPGADEDAQGIPFVGRSGRLLTDMIEKGMKISRDEVYICNVLRCRPPQNRNPLPEEAAFCRPFMEAQIRIVNPEFICCLGAVAAKNLLQTDTSIGKLRGTIHNWQGYKVVCTYHPSYLLRNPPAKKDAWIDLQLLMRAMGLM